MRYLIISLILFSSVASARNSDYACDVKIYEIGYSAYETGYIRLTLYDKNGNNLKNSNRLSFLLNLNKKDYFLKIRSAFNRDAFICVGWDYYKTYWQINDISEN